MSTIGKDKAKMLRMVDDLWKAQFWAEFEAIAVRIDKWHKAKPDNEDLQIMSKAITEMTYYVNALEKKQDILEMKFAHDSKDKINAVIRARRCEKEREKLSNKLKDLNI